MDDIIISRGRGLKCHSIKHLAWRDCANLCSKSTQNRISPEHVRTASMPYLQAVLVGSLEEGGETTRKAGCGRAAEPEEDSEQA